MAVMYATNEFEIRQAAMRDALSRCPSHGEPVEQILERADKILAWYTRAADTQEIRD
jgi:hypothetical protein